MFYSFQKNDNTWEISLREPGLISTRNGNLSNNIPDFATAEKKPFQFSINYLDIQYRISMAKLENKDAYAISDLGRLIDQEYNKEYYEKNMSTYFKIPIKKFSEKNYENIDRTVLNYALGVIFKGSYKSENGQQYSFDENGNADFNGKKIKYTSSFYSRMTSKYGYDWIETDDGSYIFMFEHNKLYLYKTTYDKINNLIDIDGEPFVILT